MYLDVGSLVLDCFLADGVWLGMLNIEEGVWLEVCVRTRYV